jgi:hypothetical protein
MPKRTDITRVPRRALQSKGVNGADPVARTALSLRLKTMPTAGLRRTRRSLEGAEHYVFENEGMSFVQVPNRRWTIIMYLTSCQETACFSHTMLRTTLRYSFR